MQASLAKEKDLCEQIVKQAAPVTLTLERVLLSDTGTLLITWTNPCGSVWQLRQGFADAFPGSHSIEQPTIIHTSLFRMLSAVNPDSYTRRAINAVCEKWTAKLRGREWTAKHVWLVYETEFSTIAGQHHVMDLQVQ